MPRIVVPFSSGAREDVDPKVMPQGALKRVENLRMRSDGRLETRFGYSFISRTYQGSGASTFTALDLASFNSRLLAFGTVSGTAPEDIYEYVNQTGFAWRPTDADHDQRLCPVTSVRDVGRPPTQADAVTVGDVAAGGGLVCSTWMVGTDTYVHIFDPETDATIEMARITGMIGARAIFASSRFFVVGIVSATVALYRFDPATDDNLTQLSDAFATGDAIGVMDATASQDGVGFIVGLSRSTPTVTLRLFDGTGTATQTITGPAVAVFALTVFRQAARVHVVVCESSDRHIDLYTYAVPSGALENTTTDIDSSFVCNMQVGICLDAGGTNLFLAYGTVDLTAPYDNEIRFFRINPATHATASRPPEWHWGILNSKPIALDSDHLFASVLLDASQPPTLSQFVGVAESQKIGAFTDNQVSFGAFQTFRPHIAFDSSTGRHYWLKYVVDKNGQSCPVISELVIESTERRQTAVIDNQLYIAGGVPQIFAGRQIVEAGFLSRPLIVSATPGSVGSITPSTTYNICAIYEWTDEQGRLHSSEPSEVIEVEMGPTDDSILVEVTKPLSLRCNVTNELYGGSVSIVVFRSLAAPDKQLLRDESAYVSEAASAGFGDIQQISLTRPDESATPGAGLNEQEIIYTQGASGARSGPNPFVSPLPCRYIWASADKLVTGGLPNESQIQESRAAFPNEPISWAENLGGRASAPERVLAVARLDERRLAWTASGIYEFTGEGLDINGVGDLGFPRRLPSPGGLYGGNLGWRSVVETAVGIFFQLSASTIYLLPRGGGAPQHIGHPIADTLADHSEIVAATYIREEQQVYFCCNTPGQAFNPVVLVYDIEYQQWFIDTYPVGIQPSFASACDYGGRFVALAGGSIYLQDSTVPASSFIETLVESGTLYPFGQGGQGQIDELQLYGEFAGNCVVTAYLSFDDGVTYTTLTAKTLTTPTYAAGQTVTLKWGPQRIRGDRVRLKFTATAASGAATAGFVYNYATVDFTPSGRSALRDTAQKG